MAWALTPRLFSAKETGELIVSHRSRSATILRSVGVLALTVTPILGPLGLTLLQLPSDCGLWAIVAMAVLMMVGLPLSAYSPYFRIYDHGFQPYRKPLRYAFWGYFIPWSEVAAVEVFSGGKRWALTTTQGQRHVTAMDGLHRDELRYLVGMLRAHATGASIDLRGWPRGVVAARPRAAGKRPLAADDE